MVYVWIEGGRFEVGLVVVVVVGVGWIGREELE